VSYGGAAWVLGEMPVDGRLLGGRMGGDKLLRMQSEIALTVEDREEDSRFYKFV